uniref:Complexin 4b n=1 Tax=Hucho hucho TaxID=62062 RepID=A0A4W5QN06_9TELE
MERDSEDKYRLPKSEQDANLMELAGDDIDVPKELLKMVDEDTTEEEEKDSILGQIQNLQNMDQIKEKASATMVEMKSKAEEKCCVM